MERGLNFKIFQIFDIKTKGNQLYGLTLLEVPQWSRQTVETVFKIEFWKMGIDFKKMKTGVITNLFMCDWITF